jgi:hypothetical protein
LISKTIDNPFLAAKSLASLIAFSFVPKI